MGNIKMAANFADDRQDGINARRHVRMMDLDDELVYGNGGVEMQRLFKDARPFMAALKHGRHALARDGVGANAIRGVIGRGE